MRGQYVSTGHIGTVYRKCTQFVFFWGGGGWYIFFRGDFFKIFKVLNLTLLHLPPLRFHSVGGCWVSGAFNSVESENKSFVIVSLSFIGSLGYKPLEYVRQNQVVTKRCRLSLLTNSAPVYESQCGGKERGCEASANEYSCAHHMTWSPNKLWRSTFLFNLWAE